MSTVSQTDIGTERFPIMCRTVRDVFDAIMSGVFADELEFDIARLPLTERAALLCTVWAIRDEVAGVCKETAQQIEHLLNRSCRLFAERGRRCHEAQCPTLLPFMDQRTDREFARTCFLPPLL